MCLLENLKLYCGLQYISTGQCHTKTSLIKKEPQEIRLAWANHRYIFAVYTNKPVLARLGPQRASSDTPAENRQGSQGNGPALLHEPCGARVIGADRAAWRPLVEELYLKKCILASALPFQAGDRGEPQGEPMIGEPGDSRILGERKAQTRQKSQLVDWTGFQPMLTWVFTVT